MRCWKFPRFIAEKRHRNYVRRNILCKFLQRVLFIYFVCTVHNNYVPRKSERGILRVRVCYVYSRAFRARDLNNIGYSNYRPRLDEENSFFLSFYLSNYLCVCSIAFHGHKSARSVTIAAQERCHSRNGRSHDTKRGRDECKSIYIGLHMTHNNIIRCNTYTFRFYALTERKKFGVCNYISRNSHIIIYG